MGMYRFEKPRDTDNLYDRASIVMLVDTVQLSELVTEFENFLRASGFVFDGHLEIVEDDE